jgi:hypothetical protein
MLELPELGIEHGNGLFMPCHHRIATRLRQGLLHPVNRSAPRKPLDSRSLSGQDELESGQVGRAASTSLLAKCFFGWMGVTFYLVLLNQSHRKHATTLRDQLHVWRQLFPGSWAASRVELGFDIAVPDGVTQSSIPPEVPEEQRKILRKLKEDQIAKEIVHIVPGIPRPEPGTFYMKSFPVPKSTPGKWRDCIDGRPLNSLTTKEHFKGEGLQQLLDQIQPWDWAITTDWDGWYNHGQLTPRSQRLCRTVLDGKILEYSSVTFGLTQAPFWLNSLVKPAFALLRSLGVRVGGQVDDWAWLGDSFLSCLVSAQLGVGLFALLGCLYNTKCRLVPSQTFVHLGAFFNTRIHFSFLTPIRVRSILGTVRDLVHLALQGKQVQVKMLASLVGKLSAARFFVVPHRIMSRELQLLMVEVVAARGWQGCVTLEPWALSLLQWWQRHLRLHNGRPTHEPPPSFHITKDASQWAWGAVIEETGEQTMGFWDKIVAGGHSTYTEVMADIVAATAFIRKHNWMNMVIGIRSDATTSVAYINKQGGPKHHLSQPVMKFLRWAFLERGITFIAAHVAGKQNKIADQLSRRFNPWTELELQQTTFNAINQVWGPHTLDLMASAANAKVERFMSWRVDPAAIATDALAQDLRSEHNIFCYPPDPLIPRVLRLAREQKLRSLTLIIPLWPSQAWYPTIRSMLCDLPLILSKAAIALPPVLIMQGSSIPSWTMCACRISGVDSDAQEFRRRLYQERSEVGKEKTTWARTMTCLSDDGSRTATDLELLMRTLM